MTQIISGSNAYGKFDYTYHTFLPQAWWVSEEKLLETVAGMVLNLTFLV